MHCFIYRRIFFSALNILFSLFCLNSFGQLSREQEKAFSSAGFINVQLIQEEGYNLDEDFFLEIAKVCIYLAGLEVKDELSENNCISLRIESEIHPIEFNSYSGVFYEGANMKGVLNFKYGEGEFQNQFQNVHTLRREGVWSIQQNVYLNKSVIPYSELFVGTDSYLDAFLNSMYKIAGEDFLTQCLLVDTMQCFLKCKNFSSNTLRFEFKKFAVIKYREVRDLNSIVPALINELYNFKENHSSGFFYDEKAYYYEIMKTLGEIADTRAIEPLVSLLEYSCENNLKYAKLNIRSALVNIGYPVIKPLEQNLPASSNNCQFELLVILAKLEDKTITDQLLPYLNSTEYYQRTTAIEALIAANDTAVIIPVIELHDKNRKEITGKALIALYEKSDSLGVCAETKTKIFNSIINNLSEGDFGLSDMTFSFLEEYGDARSVKVILDYIDRYPIKANAVKALCAIMKKEDIPGADKDLQSRIVRLLSEKLSTENITFSLYSLHIFRELRAYEAVGYLIDFLNVLGENQEASFSVADRQLLNLKGKTIETLSVITGKDFGDNLKKWNKWWLKYNKQ